MIPSLEIIDRLLLEKTGKRACMFDYKEIPEEENKYRLSTGNIHMVSGRIKTKRKADALVNEFLNTEIP